MNRCCHPPGLDRWLWGFSWRGYRTVLVCLWQKYGSLCVRCPGENGNRGTQTLTNVSVIISSWLLHTETQGSPGWSNNLQVYVVTTSYNPYNFISGKTCFVSYFVMVDESKNHNAHKLMITSRHWIWWQITECCFKLQLFFLSCNCFCFHLLLVVHITRPDVCFNCK